MQRIKRTEVDGVIARNFSFLIKDSRAGIAFVLLFISWLAICMTVIGTTSFQSTYGHHTLLINQVTDVSISSYLSGLDFGLIVFVAFLIFVYSIGVLVLAKGGNKGTKPFTEAAKRYPSLLVSSIFFFFIVFILMFALFIPSVFAFVKMIFYPQESLLKKRNPVAALHASYDFTSGKFWSVFGLVAGIMLISLAFSIIITFVAHVSLGAFIVLDSLLWAFITVFFVGAMTEYFLEEQKNVR